MQNPAAKDDIFGEIREHQKITAEGLENLKALRREEDRRIKSIRDYERYKWDKFREIIKGEEFFRFEHLKKLNINEVVTIHLSAKNSGKTTEIYREMARIIAMGKKFLYGRVYVDEMHGAINQFNVDEMSPVVVLTRENRWYFYSKKDIELWRINKTSSYGEDANISGTPRVVDLERIGIRPVGLGYTFYNSNTLGGMNYEDYTTIFFDEILSYSPINRINKRVLDAWDASISTITRQKPNIRVYMMGNLLDVPEHPILKFYGISIDDDLRIIERGQNGECVILFVNSGGLYESTFRNQAAVTKHGDLEHQAFLTNNKVQKPTPNVLNSSIFAKLKFECAFALTLLDKVLYVELRSAHNRETEEYVSCIRCAPLQISTVTEGFIFADNPNIYNSFENTTRRIRLHTPFNHVFRLYRAKQLKFDDVSSLNNYAQLLKQYRNEYLNDYAER